ncbi:MAG: FAD-dependent monooxygenase, partial [Chloroflexi bacterium]|nr:FAD-dependent monooxygenase [Chloroflexota bacterium]
TRPAGSPATARSSTPRRRRPRAIVVGGSLAGLCAGLAMQSVSYEVDVFERSPGVMHSRGAGLVAQGPVLRLLERHGVARPEATAVPSPKNQFIDRTGRVLRDDPIVRYAMSWDVLYQLLRRVFPDAHYHQGKRMVAFKQDDGRVVVRFEDGDEAAGELLIGADGVGSTTRQLLLPEVQPEYAGYVAWRGLVPQEALPADLAARFAEHFMYYDGPNFQFLTYPVPGPAGEVAPELRRINWVWYWIVPPGEPLRDVLTDRQGAERQLSVPQGFVRDDLVERQRQVARQLLPDLFYQLFEATAEPFIQAICDLAVPRMAFGRVCLVGDAAFAPRPHAAAATAKAAVDAVELAKALRGADGDIAAALSAWQPVQLELGRNVLTYARLRGNRLVFGR